MTQRELPGKKNTFLIKLSQASQQFSFFVSTQTLKIALCTTDRVAITGRDRFIHFPASDPSIRRAGEPLYFTFSIDESLPRRGVWRRQLLFDFGNIFRMQVIKQTLANQVILETKREVTLVKPQDD